MTTIDTRKRLRSAIAKEAKSAAIFFIVYSTGVVVATALRPKEGLASWIYFGAAVVLFGYVLPAVFRVWRDCSAFRNEKRA